MARLMPLVVAGFVLAPSGGAAAQAPALDPAFEKDVTRLVEVTGGLNVGEQLALIVGEQMSSTLRQQRSDLPPRAFEIVDEVVKTTLSGATRTPSGLLSRLVPIYAKHFTHEEVRGLLAFYDTPLGRKAIAVLPQVALEGAQVGQKWAAEMLPGMQAEIQKRLKSEGLVK